MRIIGLDIHRVFAEAVALEDGVFKRLGRIGMTRDHLASFARTLCATDHIVVEATGNATAVTDILAPHVARVAVANPVQVHLVAKAKIKTDAIDASVLAKLYAAGFLPEVDPGRRDAGPAPASDAAHAIGSAKGSPLQNTQPRLISRHGGRSRDCAMFVYRLIKDVRTRQLTC
jgi:transposase